MRPIKLEMEGLHSFISNQVFDFSKISGNKMFGIFGATGAGKSTVLDAIVLSLYGNVQRSKSNYDFINLKAKQTMVVFSFEVFEKNIFKKYEVVRKFKISSSGDVTQKAELYDITSGRSLVVDSPSKVDIFIKDLIGLSQNEFSKCVALPQGEFAGFLKAKPNERINIIGGIFDLAKYGEVLWERVRQRVALLKNDLTAIESKMSVYSGITREEVNGLRAEHEKLENFIEIERGNLASYNETIKKEEKLLSVKQELNQVENLLKPLLDDSSNMSDKKQLVAKARVVFGNKLAIEGVKELQAKVESDQAELLVLERQEAYEKESSNSAVEEHLKHISEIEESLKNLAERKSKLESAGEKKAFIQSLTTERQDVLNQITDIELKQSEIVQDRAKREDLIAELKARYKVVRIDYETTIAKINELSVIEQYEVLEQQRTSLTKFLDFVNSCKEKALTLKANAQAKMNSSVELYGELKAELNELRKKCKGEIEDKAIETLQDIINAKVVLLSKLNVNEEYVSNLSQRATRQEAENLSLLNKIAEEERRYNAFSNEYSSVVAELDVKVSKLAELERKQIEIVCNNSVAEFSDGFKVGDGCPICGSEILTKNVMGKLSTIVVESDIAKTKKEIDFLQKKKEDLRFTMGMSKSLIEHLKEEHTQGEMLIEKLNSEITSRCSSVLGKKNAKIVDVNIVQMQLKNEINELKKLKTDEARIEKKIEDNNLSRIKYDSMHISASDKITEYTELSGSIGEVLSGIEAKMIAIESGNNIEEKRKALSILQVERAKKDDELEKLHSQITSDEAGLRELIENSSKMQAQIDILASMLRQINDTVIESQNCIVEFSGIENMSEEIGKVESQIVIGRDEIAKRNENILQIKQKFVDLQSRLEAARRTFNEHKGMLDSQNDRLVKILLDAGIASFSEIADFSFDSEQIDELEKLVSGYEGDLQHLTARKSELLLQLGGHEPDIAVVDDMKSKIKELESKIADDTEELGKMKAVVEAKVDSIEKYDKLKQEYDVLSKRLNLETSLADMLRGKAMLEFVAEEFIDDITFMASAKLIDLMDGRYELRYKDKEFVVIDNFNGGEERNVCTLSGGETFVVSLALALSISDALMTKSDKRIDFFFLDEGFGTLDKEYCEYVVSSLTKIGGKSTTIGLISHIPELQEKINKKFIIEKQGAEKGSTVKFVDTL